MTKITAQAINSPERLAALHRLRLLDTPAEQAFDRLAGLAAKILRTPVALVSLVDSNRQFFKSCIGLPEPWSRWRETPLSHSFCQHVVTSGQPLVVSDARRDQRLQHNLAIRDIGVIAYLGIPLILQAGHTIGSFCVIDTQPRDWSEQEIGVVRDLAASVMTEIELRSLRQDLEQQLNLQTTALQKSEDQYRDLVESSLDLICTHDLQGRLLSVNQRGAEAIGYSAATLIGRNLRELLVPEYQREFDDYLVRVSREGSATGLMQVRTRAGEHQVWSYRNTLRTEGVEVPMVRGTAHDVTEEITTARQLQASEARFRATFEQAAVGIAHLAPGGRWLRVNQRLCAILGYTRDELVARSFQEITHPDDLDADLTQVREVLANTLQSYSMEKRYFRKDGRTVWTNLTVSLVRKADGAPEYFIAVVEDIDARRRTENRVRNSEALLAESQRIAHLGSFEWDAASGDLRWSEELYRIYGVTPQDFLPSIDAFIARVHPDDRGRVKASVSAILATGEAVSYEERIQRPDGEVRVLVTEVTPVKDDGGHVLRLVGACHDITERRQAEMELAGTSEQLHELLTNMADGFVRLDTNWHYTFVNKRAGLMFGRDPETLIGKNIWKEFPEGVGQPFYLAYQKAMMDLQPSHIQSYYPPWDKWFENRIYPSKDGLSIFFEDITARTRSEIALRDSEEKYRVIFEQATDGILISDIEGHFLDANPAGCQMLGYSRHELLNMCIAEIVVPDETPRIAPETARLQDGNVVQTEWRVLRRDGLIRLVEVGARQLPDGRLQAFLRDITERKEAEGERKRLIDELTVRNAEMENFIYTISHDLKTPLITIGGFSGLLEKDIARGDNEAVADSLAEIKKGIEQMQAHIRDLLLLSRTGRVKSEMSDLPLAVLLNEVVGQFGRRLAEEGAQLTVTTDFPVVRVDRKGLMRVFTNLIDNALKYRRAGVAPHIEIGWQQDSDELRLFVRDNGQGIKKEFQERIFGLFQRADSKTEGAGVGLAISKRVMEVHGGRMWVESRPGKGSTFWLSLPTSAVVTP